MSRRTEKCAYLEFYKHMNAPGKKNFFKKLLHIGTLARYMSESAGIVRQGAGWRDKLILFSYYLKIPSIVIKSLATGKSFRELEERKKFLKGQVTISNRYGRFDCGNNILTVYTVNKNNEKHLYQYFNLTGGIFIDVGAHVGKYSIPAAKNAAVTVVALEPDEYNFGLLKKNVALNHLPNIICINKGAYSSPGKISFYTTEQGEGMHSIFKQAESKQEKKIEVDTLDNIIEQLNTNSPVSLMKIDVEGAEYDVLQGAEKILQKYHPGLIVEIWQHDPARLARVKEYLQRFGYKNAQHLDKDNVHFTFTP
jgi:FkbM family methyltransferase